MVRIRMRRTGSNKDVCYRVVATDKRSPRDGKCLETLGWYDPKMKAEINFDLKLDRIEFWRSHGAQISEKVLALLKRGRVADAAAKAAAPAAPVELASV